jgi:hypothetical protein
MRYDLTHENDERIHLTRQPVEMAEEAEQEMPQVWEEPAAAPVKRKGPDIGRVAHYIFTTTMLAVGGFMLLAGVYLVWQEEEKGDAFFSAGVGLITVALVLRGVERCARALEKLAGE